MTNKEFLNIINDASRELNREKVEKMMYAEIDKAPDEMDTEFIEACAEYILNHKNDPKPVKKITLRKAEKRNIKKLKPLLIAAIAAALLAAGSVTACAAYSPSFKDDVVSFFSDHAAIYYSKKDTSKKTAAAPREDSKLYQELKEGGIADILLPDTLYDMKHKKLNWQNDDVMTSVCINYTKNETIVTIQNFKDKKWVYDPDIQGKFSADAKVNINGVDVYLFERNGNDESKVNTTISYQVGLTQYSIYYPYPLEKAEEFIKNMN